MPTLKSHRLVRADFQSAYGWHEEKCPGLGLQFAAEFRRSVQKIREDPLLCSIRFSGIRRLNLDRFPYGVFYFVTPGEVRILAVLHGSRETKGMLAARRRTFSQS